MSLKMEKTYMFEVALFKQNVVSDPRNPLISVTFESLSLHIPS